MKHAIRILLSLVIMSSFLFGTVVLSSCSDWDQDLTTTTSGTDEETFLSDESLSEMTEQRHEVIDLVSDYMETVVSCDTNAV